MLAHLRDVSSILVIYLGEIIGILFFFIVVRCRQIICGSLEIGAFDPRPCPSPPPPPTKLVDIHKPVAKTLHELVPTNGSKLR